MNLIKRVTIRKQLVPGESLLSYLTRVADANGRDTVCLLDMIKRNEDYRLHSGDLKRIDFFPASMINIERLCELTSLTRETVNKSSFTNLIRVFKDSENGETSRILEGILREDLYYCPECIAQTNSIALHWKLIGVEVCIVHNKHLISKCEHCNKPILYQDIRVINRCPYCSGFLTKAKDKKEVVDKSILKQQAWLIDNWKYLIEYSGQRFSSSEIATRMLYILNQRQDYYDKALIRNSRYPWNIEHLIQCARGTLYQKCAVHMAILFFVLFEAGLNIWDFFELHVSEEFVKSLHEKSKGEIAAETACAAPWCNQYGVKGQLVSTRVFQSQKGGRSLSYCMVCLSCGCEYALDEENHLVERSYFIKAYEILSVRNITKLTWPEKVKVMGLKRGRIQRVLAYFKIRNVIDMDDVIEPDIDEKLLDEFVLKLREGTDLAKIRFWKEWTNYDQFLMHRYHPNVIQTLFKSYTEPKAKGNDVIFRKNIENACMELLETDHTINLSTIAKVCGTSVGTIRNKGCSDIVELYRKKQITLNHGQISLEIEQKVKKYLKEHEDEKVAMKELYAATDTDLICLKSIHRC